MEKVFDSIEERKMQQSDEAQIQKEIKIQELEPKLEILKSLNTQRSVGIQELVQRSPAEIKLIKSYYMKFNDENIKKHQKGTAGKTEFTQYKNNELFKTQDAALLNVYANLESQPDKGIMVYPSITANGFFDAFYMAYALHGSFVMSPDDVWLQIAMQFSEYVNHNAERLRNLFVDHQGQKILSVFFDDPDPDNYKKKDFKWDYFTSEFSKKISENTKAEVKKVIESNFSTSGLIEKAAAEITLMRSMEPYFKYHMVCGCGLREVHFRGTEQDWMLLKQKIQALEKLGMDAAWVEVVLADVEEIINTFNGKVNVKFWNSGLYYDYVPGPSGFGEKDGFNGWIKHFFYFDNKGRPIGSSYDYAVKLADIPKSVIYTPVLLINQYHSFEVNLRYLAGFEGYAEIGNLNFRPVQKIAFAEVAPGKIYKKAK